MISSQILSFAFLTLTLVATPGLAQPATGESTEPAAQSPDSGTAEQSAPESQGPTTESPSPVSGNDSPYDYRPSEEISEDFSVSFPVDI